jgi:hypothetical protein
MKIIDIIIRSYLYISRGKSIKHLYRAVSAANILLSLNVCALLSYLIGPHLKSLDIVYNGVVTVIVVGSVIGVSIWRLLIRIYLNKRGYSRILNTYVPKVMCILIVIVHWLLSSYLLVESLFSLPRP